MIAPHLVTNVLSDRELSLHRAGQAGLKSLAEGQKHMETPQLAVRYQARRESLFWQS